VLAFPDQEIGVDDPMRFGRYFGRLSVHPSSTNSDYAPEPIVFYTKAGRRPAAAKERAAEDLIHVQGKAG